MKALDTNVLLRLLVEDDAAQTRRAAALARAEAAAGRPLLVNLIVLCELVWVLRRAYRFPADRIAVAIEALLEAPAFALQEPDIVRDAVAVQRAGGDFVDAVIAAVNRTLGADETATFDQAAARLDGFLLVE